MVKCVWKCGGGVGYVCVGVGVWGGDGVIDVITHLLIQGCNKA